MLALPLIENWTAKVLAKSFREKDLARGIAYLELVRTRKYVPGPEMFALGINALSYNVWEIEAVQRRLALAIYYQRNT